MFESANLYRKQAKRPASSGFGVGQQAPPNDGPDLALLLLTGFALAAGAGIFHGIAWGIKRIAKGKTLHEEEETP